LARASRVRPSSYYKPVEAGNCTINGEYYRDSSAGSPILESAIARVEISISQIVTRGDHHIVVGEAVGAHADAPIEGQPDVAILYMRELGDNVYYNG